MAQKKRPARKRPELSDVVARLRRAAPMTKEQWQAAGCPTWVIYVEDTKGLNDLGRVWYRTWVPAYAKLDVHIRTTVGTTGVYAGTLVEGFGGMQKITPNVIAWSEYNELDDGVGGRPPLLLWDRSMVEARAQRFDPPADGTHVWPN